MPTHYYLILCNQINSARFFLFHGSKLWYGFVVLCLEAVQQYGTTYQWLLCQFSSKTFFYRIWYDFIWLLVISCEAKCLRILSFWHWKKALLHLQSSVLHFYRLFNTTPWGTAQKNAFSRCLQSKIHEKAEFDGLHLIWLSYACHFLMSIECPLLNAVFKHLHYVKWYLHWVHASSTTFCLEQASKVHFHKQCNVSMLWLHLALTGRFT